MNDPTKYDPDNPRPDEVREAAGNQEKTDALFEKASTPDQESSDAVTHEPATTTPAPANEADTQKSTDEETAQQSEPSGTTSEEVTPEPPTQETPEGTSSETGEGSNQA